MKYSECIMAVELTLESNDVPLIVGESGIGKTTMVKQIAYKNNCYFVNIDANLLKEGEIGGLPVVHNNITVYATYHKLAEIQRLLIEDENKKVILFIDELNRCDHAVSQELMNLILNREINGYKLDDRVKVVAAMNPSNKNDGFYDSRYEVVDMDPAQEDRFVWIELESDIKEWLKWAMSSEGNIHEDIIEFLSAFPQYLHMPDNQSTVKPTPRSWERVSKAYRVYLNKKEKYSINTFLNVVKGNIGNDVCNDFSAFIMNLKNPIISSEEIYNNDILASDLKDKISKESSSRLYITFKNAVVYLKDNINDRNMSLFCEMLDLYPRDLRLGIMKEIKHDYKGGLYERLLDNDEFLDAFFNIFK